MILPYWFRLASLCLSVGVCGYAVGSLAASLAGSWVLRRLDRRSAAGAANLVLAVRLLPGLLAAAVVGGWCIPSYLWLEPLGRPEFVGATAMALAAAGALLVAWTAARALLASLRSLRFNAWAARRGETRRVGSTTVRVLPHPSPMLALSGLLRSHFVVSRDAARRLSEVQLEAALHHERAHLRARDNCKRLVLFALPAWSAPLRALERAWEQRIEWAADDAAVAADPACALPLAAALIELARGHAAPRPLAPVSCLGTAAPAADRNRELAVRVHRLLAPSAPPAPSAWWRAASALGVAALAALMLQPATLLAVHQTLERLAH